jgi:hypothetical protein
MLGRLPDIIGRLGEMAGRFCTTLDCASVGSLPTASWTSCPKHLVEKPGRARRYHVTPEALRTITAVTIIRDKVLAPLLGEVRKPRRVVTRKNWTPMEHDYEKLRSGMEDFFGHLGILTAA